MILVVGGAYAGKRAYAASLGYGEAEQSDARLGDAPVIYNLQNLVRRHLEAGRDAGELAPLLIQKAAVLCDEVGAGVIPIDAQERRYREAVGRLLIVLAGEAEHVVRVVCGIPVPVKGGLPCTL